MEFSGTMGWMEEEEAKSQHGEGISRPMQGAETSTFRVLVKQYGAAIMSVHMKAESAEHALRYARARWPLAHVRLGN